MGKMRVLCARGFLAVALASIEMILVSNAIAMPLHYTDRQSFLAGVGQQVTDGYSSYGATIGTSVVLSDSQMSVVLGETRYESISFSNLNLVGDVYIYGDGTDYCAGCNGNFRLFFDDTSLTDNGGVFGVGVDVVLHTSRHSAIGDIILGDSVVDGTVLVEFTDGVTDTITVPADIGFFGPEIFFIGLTDEHGIKSMTFGVEPMPLRHTWVIDNLTVAADVPEPSTILLLGAGFAGVGSLRRKRR